MIGFFIALLSGAMMSIQGVFNTQVTKTTGVWVSNGWVQITAFAVCLAAWFFTGRDSVAALGKVEPKYMLLGGVIGAGITWTVIKSIEALGPAKSALLIVIAQLAVSYVIELFGLFGMDKEPFSWRKLGGTGSGCCRNCDFPVGIKGFFCKLKMNRNKIVTMRQILNKHLIVYCNFGRNSLQCYCPACKGYFSCLRK